MLPHLIVTASSCASTPSFTTKFHFPWEKIKNENPYQDRKFYCQHTHNPPKKRMKGNNKVTTIFGIRLKTIRQELVPSVLVLTIPFFVICASAHFIFSARSFVPADDDDLCNPLWWRGNTWVCWCWWWCVKPLTLQLVILGAPLGGFDTIVKLPAKSLVTIPTWQFQLGPW